MNKKFLPQPARILAAALVAMAACGPLHATEREGRLISSGPMLAYSEMTEVAVWVQTSQPLSLDLAFWVKGRPSEARFGPRQFPSPANDHIARFTLKGLEPGTRYNYELRANGRRLAFDYPLEFQTQPQWRFRTDPPAMRFAIGSCAFINDPKYDRPGKPYGGDYEIYRAIHKDRPDFMVWLGDNVYYREPDYYTEAGMRYRWRHDRQLPEWQALLASTHHYGMWDDHDYGPDNSDRSFRLKETSLRVFADYLPAVQYGTKKTPGCFQRFEWGDAEFFLMDDRTYRSPNDTHTTDPQKVMWGAEQFQWLKDGLLNSPATFKFVCNGNQVLNTRKTTECLYGTSEYPEFMAFLREYRVGGVILLTGDIHATELLEARDEGLAVPLYEYTCSPLNSGFRKNDVEPGNNRRVPGTRVEQRNYGIIEITGKRNERVVMLSCIDKDGNELWRHRITEREISTRPLRRYQVDAPTTGSRPGR